MPNKSKRPCSYPGCPELTDERYCEEHKKQTDKEYNKYQRNPEHRKQYGTLWRKIRIRYMKAHPFCEQCMKDGKITKAEECHHILPLCKGGTHEENNLMALCKSCHSKITAKEGNRWG